MIDSFGCTVSAGVHPPDPLHLVADFQRFRNALLRAVTFQVCAGYAKTELLSGVTTLRSVGGIQAVDSCLRDKILSGKAVGPRILAGNMAVSVPGGHMAGSLAYEATSPEGAAALVRKIAEDKPDLIKLMITGGVLDAKCKGEPSGGSESSAPYRSGHGPGKPDPCPQGQKNREGRAGVGQIPVKSKKIRQKEPPQDFHSVAAPLMQ